MKPSTGPSEPSLFEDQLRGIEASMGIHLGAREGGLVANNIGSLRRLLDMSKIELEAYFGQRCVISLNDVDYERLQAKMQDLLDANLREAEAQGV